MVNTISHFLKEMSG